MAGDQQRMWPGYHADGEPERLIAERQREEQIRARNLSARIQADLTPDRIDRATGRTFADGRARGFYDDDRVIGDFRAANARFRGERERFRWTQARDAGRAGRN